MHDVIEWRLLSHEVSGGSSWCHLSSSDFDGGDFDFMEGELVQLKWGKLEEVNVSAIKGYGHVIE